ncbi:MAG: HAD family hydrolase [Candidatus Helarchaeota archaeon]
MIKGILFDFDGTLSSENSITFIMKWQIRRNFESENNFNPFYGILNLNRIFFYGFRYTRHLRNLFSKKNYEKPIDEIITEYGKYISKYYPYILRSFKNISKENLAKISKMIPLRPGVKELLLKIKEKGIKIGICSMSLEIAALTALDFIKFDYIACNNLIYERKHTAKSTGDSMLVVRNAEDKKKVILDFSKVFNFSLADIAFVGDDFHDILAADAAGIGLILYDLTKIDKNVGFFYKKAMDQYNFKIIYNILDVKKYINL